MYRKLSLLTITLFLAGTLSAKDIVLTLTNNRTYKYLINGKINTVMRITTDSVYLNGDAYLKSKVKEMRIYNAMPEFVLDEHVAFDKNMQAKGSKIILAKSLTIGEWNTLVLPVYIPAAEVKRAFGNDVQLVRLTDIDQNGKAVYSETSSISPHNHYLIKPSKNPTFLAGEKYYKNKIGTIEGPLYVIYDANIYNTKEQTTQDFTNHTIHGTYSPTETPTGAMLLKNEYFISTALSTAINGYSYWAEPKVANSIISPDQFKSINYPVYDLKGKRIYGKPEKGIYIINKKKYVIK